MVSKGVIKRKAEVEKITKIISSYPTIGVIDLYKLPAAQLLDIRSKLAGKAVIKVTKKSIIERALNLAGLQKLIPYIKGMPALLLSKLHPLALADDILGSKSFAQAKPGDIPTSDVWIRAGPTDLAPGPAIGELQRAGLQVAVEGNRIVIKADKLFLPAGQPIKKEQADIATKLGLKPIEIILNVLAAWDGSIIFEKDILFKSLSTWEEELILAKNACLALALASSWPIPDILPILISKCYQSAVTLSIAAGWPTKETIGHIIALAAAQAKTISQLV
jgi:large subunit ribosomal protein L10